MYSVGFAVEGSVGNKDCLLSYGKGLLRGCKRHPFLCKHQYPPVSLPGSCQSGFSNFCFKVCRVEGLRGA